VEFLEQMYLALALEQMYLALALLCTYFGGNDHFCPSFVLCYIICICNLWYKISETIIYLHTIRGYFCLLLHIHTGP